jgi:hypothetical protein
VPDQSSRQEQRRPEGQDLPGLPQVFLPRANLFYRAFLRGALVLSLAGAIVWYQMYRSPFVTEVKMPIGQPVPFSHRHHVGELKMDCRYCHTSVEKSSFAGVPSTQICMTCHSRLFTGSPLLQRVRESAATGRPILWNRVHILPDYVYFDHSIHVNKGVGCTTCHGQVNEMALTWKSNTLFMQWCLQCHRDPQNLQRPLAQIYSLSWKPGADQQRLGAELAMQHHLETEHLTNCSVCHR